MEVRLLGEEKLEFRWPDGVVEEYNPAERYSVVSDGEVLELLIGHGWRQAFGRRRRRVIVFDGDGLWPIIELVGTDDYERTKDLVWPLKRPGTNAQYGEGSKPNPDFLTFTMVRFPELVTGPHAFRGRAALVSEQDTGTILRLALVRRRHRKSNVAEGVPETQPPAPKFRDTTSSALDTSPRLADRLAVSGSLLEYGHRLAGEGATGVVEFTGESAADELVRDNGLAFFLAVIADQGVPAERAWILPYRLSQRLGHLDATRIAETSPAVLAGVIAGPPSLHRFPNMIADWIVEACRRLTALGIQAQDIWMAGRTSQEIASTLESFKGIGQKKSSMATNILVRDLGVRVTDWESIDVSYDVHVRRVFLRAGLVGRDTEEDVISAARHLNPRYPGALDLPAWFVGRQWCHPSTPDCGNCAIGEACLRRVELDVDSF